SLRRLEPRHEGAVIRGLEQLPGRLVQRIDGAGAVRIVRDAEHPRRLRHVFAQEEIAALGAPAWRERAARGVVHDRLELLSAPDRAEQMTLSCGLLHRRRDRLAGL